MTKWLNPLWWKFYWQADTIYQIHSPFLFDFATNLWPQIDSDPNSKQYNALGDEASITTWLHYLCGYYRMDHLIINSSSILVHSLKDKSATSLLDDNPSHSDQLVRYNINNENYQHKTKKGTSDFSTIGVFSAATLVEMDLHPLVEMNDSCVILCHDIHSTRSQYLRWKEILGRSEFSFSIELFNFGILFKHPVNQQPEHITLISWRKKPWKIKIL